MLIWWPECWSQLHTCWKCRTSLPLPRNALLLSLAPNIRCVQYLLLHIVQFAILTNPVIFAKIQETWSCHLSATSCKASIPPLAKRGNLMWTEALIAVPRLVGQNVSHPSLSSEVKDMRESMCSIPSIRSWNTRPTSPPGAIEMIRRWSSSPTHTRKVFSSLWKIPRPVGQYRLAFAAWKMHTCA